MPTGKHIHERNKDRLSYTHQLFKVDLTQVKGPEVYIVTDNNISSNSLFVMPTD